jgi:nicotinamide-nucleotide amidase
MSERRPEPRRILVAELLAIGSELTVGDTVDTNTGELARSLTASGVRVSRISDLPDDLEVVIGALGDALARNDLVVTTGGLGPTPDDLTREAVAALCGEHVSVEPATLAWLRELWARRGLPFPEVNVKQAWVIPSAMILPNPNGTAPGWWVDRPDGRVIVTLPGPPREMRPMWHDEVLPRLEGRGLGREVEIRTLRLMGIGESQVADVLGEELLRSPNPTVATYARAEAVDVRISARREDGTDREPARSARDLADAAEARVRAILGRHVWATGAARWVDAVGDALATRGWRLATVETGSGGALVTLLRDASWLRHAEVIGSSSAPLPEADAATTSDDEPDPALLAQAEQARRTHGTEVGVAIRLVPAGEDTVVSVAVVTPHATRTARRLAFRRGSQGHDRAAIASAAVLLETLRTTTPD